MFMYINRVFLVELPSIDHLSLPSAGGHSNDIAVFSRISEIRNIYLPARIDFFLTVLCERGTLEICYNECSHLLTASSLIVLRPGRILRSYKASDDFRGHCIVVGTSLLGNTLPTMSRLLPCILQFMDNPVIKLSKEELSTQIMMRNAIMHVIQHPEPGHEYHKDVVRTLSEAMFFDTLGIYMAHAPEETESVSPLRKNTLLLDFIRLVESNFRIHRSVKFYARELCVSAKHLSAMVKEASGRTAGEWIDAYVINEAKLLLRNTGMTIQEVSMSLNFSNQSFFGKYFRHLTGVSPRVFRVSSPN